MCEGVCVEGVCVEGACVRECTQGCVCEGVYTRVCV